MTRALALAALLGSSVAVAGPHLELEVGAGISGPDFRLSDFSNFSRINASFSGRVGLDLFEIFTPSVRVMFANPVNLTDTTGWTVLGELRLHTPGVFQLTGGVAFGVSSVNMIYESVVSGQNIAPYLTADIGIRFKLGPILLGVGVGGSPWVSPHWNLLANVGVSLFD
jgi:hypothetical protein